MSGMFWHLEFYQVNPDGTRLGPDRVTDRSLSIKLAISQWLIPLSQVDLDMVS